MITFDRERLCDFTAVESLLDTAFGQDRYGKSSYKIRNEYSLLPSLSLVAKDAGQVVGTVRFWNIRVHDMLGGQDQSAVLLGPLAVSPRMRGLGLGTQIMNRALRAVDLVRHEKVLLVGDVGFYNRFGFSSVLPKYITMPGGEDADRLLVRYRSPTVKPLPLVGQVCAVGEGETVPIADIAQASVAPAFMPA